MKNRFVSLFFLISIINLSTKFTFANQGIFDDSKNYVNNNPLKLGNPEQIGNDLLKYREDTSNLANLSDEELSNVSVTSTPRKSNNGVENGGDLLLVSSQIMQPINPDEPFLKNSLKIEDNPMKYVNMTPTKKTQKVRKEDFSKCIEGIEFETNLERRLTYYPPPQRQKKICIGNAHHNDDDPLCDEFIMQDIPRIESDGREEWSLSGEDVLKINNCYELSNICLESGSRNFGELVVTRPCWRYKIIYKCRSEPVNGCQYFKKRGCELKKSKCLTEISPCMKWEKIYDCGNEIEFEYEELSGGGIFCLEGNCHKPEPKANQGMNEAIAHLGILNGMSKDMSPTNPPTIFKGESDYCERYVTNFCDCCADLDGWGKTIGLTKCNANELNLAKKRKKGLCVYVGSYVDTKFIGIDISTRQVYVCFASKIGRILHEQGRAQIGRGFGSPKNPDSDPLTISETQRMKFDQMDFSEIFDDILPSNISEKAQKSFPQQFKNQMPKMQKNINQGSNNVISKIF